MSNAEAIDYNEAVERVGKLMFRSDWVGQLNGDEWKLLDTYQSAPPLSKQRREEFDKAVDKRKEMDRQFDLVDRRLENAKLYFENAAFSEGSHIPRDTFEEWFKILVAIFGTSSTPTVLETVSPQKGQSGTIGQRGRKPKYDWEAFNKIAAEKLDFEGGISPAHDVSFNQAALEEYMAMWCGTQWTEAPSESTIRARIVDLLKDREKGR